MTWLGRHNPLINRNFALLWAAQGLSFMGDRIFDTTLVVWIGVVLARGQSWAPLAVSGVFVAAAVPTLVIGPIAGVFVDRWDKRRILYLTDAVRAASIALLLLLTESIGLRHGATILELSAIYVVVFVAASCSQFFSPARIALIADVVPESARPQATSMSQINSSLSSIIGPPIAVPVLFVLGIEWALIVNALSFACSAGLAYAVRGVGASRRSEVGQATHFFRELREGLQFTMASTVARTVLVALFLVMLGASTINALDIFFVTTNLHTSANLYGFVSAAMGGGVLIGALVAGAVASRIKFIRLFWISLTALGVLLVVYARMTTFLGAVVVLFLAGFPQAAVNVVVGPMLLAAVPRALIGRVFSLLQPVVTVAGLASTATSGFLASSLLFGLHMQIGPIEVGTYDTIFSIAGLLIVAGGLYAQRSLAGRPTV